MGLGSDDDDLGGVCGLSLDDLGITAAAEDTTGDDVDGRRAVDAGLSEESDVDEALALKSLAR